MFNKKKDKKKPTEVASNPPTSHADPSVVHESDKHGVWSLVVGPPHSGKSTFVRQLRLSKDKYPVVQNSTQVMDSNINFEYGASARTVSTTTSKLGKDDETHVNIARIFENETELFEKNPRKYDIFYVKYDLVTGMIKIVQFLKAKGVFVLSEAQATTFETLRKKMLKVKAKGYRDGNFTIQDDEIDLLKSLSKRREVKQALIDRFSLRADSVVDVTDGFAKLVLKSEGIWNELKDENMSNEFKFWCIHTPSGGLPLTVHLETKDEGSSTTTTKLHLTELSGRLDSFKLLVENTITKESTAKLGNIAVVVSLADFRDETFEDLFSRLMIIKENVGEHWKNLSVFLVFTKTDVLLEKVKFWKKNGNELRLAVRMNQNLDQSIFDDDDKLREKILQMYKDCVVKVFDKDNIRKSTNLHRFPASKEPLTIIFNALCRKSRVSSQ